MTKHLYIIGNGFDLHHKYCSDFADYGKWLMENHPNIYYSLENWFNIPVHDEEDNDQYKEWMNWWSDFERRLGELMIRSYIEDAAYRALNEMVQADERRSYHIYAGERIADNELSTLVSHIKGTFNEWILSLAPGEKWLPLPIEKASSVFLSFNYTRTLENIYHIPRENILYIHGALDSENYILGHGLTYQEIEELCDNEEEYPDNLSIQETEAWHSAHSDDFMTDQVKRVAIQCMIDLRKDVEQIIKDNKIFLEQLNELKFIHVYGFSFSSIDLPYIHAIISKVDIKNVQWEISFFSKKDKANIERFIELANIPKDNIQLIRLTDIQIDPQLTIPYE